MSEAIGILASSAQTLATPGRILRKIVFALLTDFTRQFNTRVRSRSGRSCGVVTVTTKAPQK